MSDMTSPVTISAIDFIGALCRDLLAIVFLVAAYAKLRDLPAFAETVKKFNIGIFRPVVVGVPLAEMLIAVALSMNITIPWAAGAAIALLAVFLVTVILLVLKGKKINCACFGVSQGELGITAVVRNILLMVAATVALYFGKTQQGWLFSVHAWISALALVLFYVVGEKLVQYWQKPLRGNVNG